MKTQEIYWRLVNAAADLWEGTDPKGITLENEYLRGQAELIANTYVLDSAHEKETVMEDIRYRMRMNMPKTYEVSITNTFEAASPEEAAQRFIEYLSGHDLSKLSYRVVENDETTRVETYIDGV